MGSETPAAGRPLSGSIALAGDLRAAVLQLCLLTTAAIGTGVLGLSLITLPVRWSSPHLWIVLGLLSVIWLVTWLRHLPDAVRVGALLVPCYLIAAIGVPVYGSTPSQPLLLVLFTLLAALFYGVRGAVLAGLAVVGFFVGAALLWRDGRDILPHAGRVFNPREPTFWLRVAATQMLGITVIVSTVLYILRNLGQTMRRLHESEGRFAKMFRASPDSVSVHDTTSGRILDVNDSFERQMGYTRAQVIGRTTSDLGFWLDPAQRQQFIALLQREGSVRDFARQVRAPDGRIRTFLMSADLIELGGQPCNITVARDVTDQLAAEHALRESEEKFAKAFRASPDLMVILELATGRYLDLNQAHETILGYSRAECLGRTPVELGFLDERFLRDELLPRLHHEGALREFEAVVRTRSRTPLVLALSAERLTVGGRECLLGVARDVTARRRAEQERTRFEGRLRESQKLEALGTLAGGIAHDFNNILTAILAYADFARLDAADPAAVREHAAEVTRAGHRARDLVQRILTFSRRQEPSRQIGSLAPAILEAAQLLRSTLPAGIELRCEIHPHSPAVLADASQVHQVVMNLGTNAAHALPGYAGHIHIRLDACQLGDGESLTLPAGVYARLRVIDDGHGMTPETMKRIFDPFFTTKAPGQGTGLGLAVVHGIVQAHEGDILVESRPDAGTTFTVLLPAHTAGLSPAPEPDPGVHSTPPLPAPAFGQGLCILVVDDEPAIGTALQRFLARAGFQPHVTTDPREALAWLQADPGKFAALVTDLSMPHLSGIDLSRHALALRPDLPIVLTTGFGGDWTPERARAEGIRELLLKPLSGTMLVETLRRALAST